MTMGGRNDARADGHGRVYQASGDQHITEHHYHAPDWSGPDSVRRPAVGRAPVVLRDRSGEMDRLRAAVGPGVCNGVYVLHGLGGCGKTAVAHAVFHYATNEADRVGLWVNASDPASLRAGMLAVAADRGATDGELVGARSGLRPAADLVWHYLDHSDQPWLLVLDNADTPAILRDGGWLRTSPSGTVIVTTRQAAAHWWPGAELLQFGVLPREDAARILQDLAPHAGSIEDAAEVADRLGRLPLALTLAGGFLAHQVIDPWSLLDYRHRLDGDAGQASIELLDQGAQAVGADSRHLPTRTWQMSLDALVAQGVPEATHLLRLLACWAGDPLPLRILSNAELGSQLPPSRIESALRGLLDHCLVELVPGEVRCLRAHGILLDSVAEATPGDERERLVTTVVRQMQKALPEVPERGTQDPVVTLLAPHVVALLRRVADWGVSESAAERTADCALRLIVAIHRSGDYASALTLANEAVELLTPCLNSANPLLFRIRQRVGRALFRLGRFRDSESVYREVLEECEHAFGPEAPDTLESCLRLAIPMLVLDRAQEATPLVLRAVRGKSQSLGDLHPLTLIARKFLLALASVPIPEREEIIATGPALIADCRSATGDDSLMTLGAELNYADVLYRAGKPDQALPHAQKALAGYERLFHAYYPLLLNARHALGAVLAALERQNEAIEQMEKVVEGRMQVLGSTHPWTNEAAELLSQWRDGN